MTGNNEIINIGDIPVIITKEETEAVIKAYEHHIKVVMPEVCRQLGVDINEFDSYHECLEEFR